MAPSKNGGNRTRRMLVAAMRNLLTRQNFQKITVNDICEEAMISRSTFYVHFEDKYALLKQLLADIRIEIAERDQDKGPRERILTAMEHLQENAKWMTNTFAGNYDRELIRTLQEYFSDGFLKLIEMKEDIPPESARIHALFYAAGVASVAGWWVMNRFPVSAEQIADEQFLLLSPILPEDFPLA